MRLETYQSADVGCLGQQKPSFAGALGVVFNHNVTGSPNALRLQLPSHTRAWGLHDSVLQLHSTDLKGRKEGCVCKRLGGRGRSCWRHDCGMESGDGERERRGGGGGE
jgi:hypothetical protein